MPPAVITAVAVIGTLHLAAYYTGRWRLAGSLKALPILLLAAAAAAAEPSVGARYARLVVAGLLLSAMGDVLLVWRRGFVWGLSSFLLGHCCYLAAFASGPEAATLAWPWLVGIGASSGALLAVLWPHLGQVRGPVLVYVTVIAAMAWTAARRAGTPDVPAASGAAALSGALLFMASDAILSFDRFAYRFAGAHAVVMVTYYAAQTLIAASVGDSS